MRSLLTLGIAFLLASGRTGPGGPGMVSAGHGTCDPSRQTCTAGLVDSGGLTTSGDVGRPVSLTTRRRPPVTPEPPRIIEFSETALSRGQVRREPRRLL